MGEKESSYFITNAKVLMEIRNYCISTSTAKINFRQGSSIVTKTTE